MISLNAKNLESVLLAETHVAVVFSCRTLTRSVKVSCRTLQIAEPKALNLEKDYLAEPWNVGSFRVGLKIASSVPRLVSKRCSLGMNRAIHMVCVVHFEALDDRQITHLTCVCLKNICYMTF